MARVAIVIVTWNSAAEIGRCLDALAGLPGDGIEVVVVDNASSGTASGGRGGIARRCPVDREFRKCGLCGSCESSGGAPPPRPSFCYSIPMLAC